MREAQQTARKFTRQPGVCEAEGNGVAFYDVRCPSRLLAARIQSPYATFGRLYIFFCSIFYLKVIQKV
jgi:hypothetical protein